MLQQIIDRRLSGKNKSIGNRERFLRRYQGQIREAVRQARRRARHPRHRAGRGHPLPKRDITEPIFGHGPGGGARDRPSRQPGIRARRPHRAARRAAAGGGSGSGQARRFRRGRGRLRLPPHQGRVHGVLLRRPGAAAPDADAARRDAGDEEPARRLLNARQRRPTCTWCARCAARSAAASRSAAGPRAALRDARGSVSPSCRKSSTPRRSSRSERDRARRSRSCARGSRACPSSTRRPALPQPRAPAPARPAKAVMFCLMDVSGSMDEARKNLAKRFFILLYLFLTRALREDRPGLHPPPHPGAGSRRGELLPRPRDRRHRGVQRAVLMDEIIRERYPPTDWNIYGAQASRRRQLAPRLAAAAASC